MPSQAILTEKQAIVATMVERLQKAEGGVFVDYCGINVADDTDLRRSLREANVDYSVIKNTLTRRACEQVGFGELSDMLNGTTSLATSENDALAALNIISERSKKMGDTFNIKAAFMDGQILTDAQIAELSVIPSRDALYSKVLGTMLAPITSLAVVLGQVVEQGGGSVASVAAEEAPAEEAAPAAE